MATISDIEECNRMANRVSMLHKNFRMTEDMKLIRKSIWYGGLLIGKRCVIRITISLEAGEKNVGPSGKRFAGKPDLFLLDELDQSS